MSEVLKLLTNLSCSWGRAAWRGSPIHTWDLTSGPPLLGGTTRVPHGDCNAYLIQNATQIILSTIQDTFHHPVMKLQPAAKDQKLPCVRGQAGKAVSFSNILESCRNRPFVEWNLWMVGGSRPNPILQRGEKNPQQPGLCGSNLIWHPVKPWTCGRMS